MSGHVPLTSQAKQAGRAEFSIRMKRGGTYDYQVFGLKNGLMLLNLAYCDARPGPEHFDGTIGSLGGMVGGRLGRLIGDALESAGQSPAGESGIDFSDHTDEALVELARKQKGTLIAPYDDIDSALIAEPTAWEVWTRGGAVAALLTIRERQLKTMVWEIRDLKSLVTASEFLSAKLGERFSAQIN